MSFPRFFLKSPFPTSIGSVIELKDEVHHHLSRVLRLKAGEGITLFNGTGGEYTGTILDIQKKNTSIEITGYLAENRTASLKVNLGICVLKKDAMDRVIARAVELGVASITPLFSDFSTVAKKVVNKRIDHWQQVVIASCEQCGLNLLPPIMPSTEIGAWVAGCNGKNIICLPQSVSLDASDPEPGQVNLLVGPEGGFSATELDDARQAGFQEVTFGERVLRAETAPLVALSVLHRTWGDY